MKYINGEYVVDTTNRLLCGMITRNGGIIRLKEKGVGVVEKCDNIEEIMKCADKIH